MRINAGSKLTAQDVSEAVRRATLKFRQDIYVEDLTTTPRGAIVFHLASFHGRFATNRQGRGEGGRAASWTAWGYVIAQLFKRDPDAIIGQYKGVTDFKRTCRAYGPHRRKYGDHLRFLQLVNGIESRVDVAARCPNCGGPEGYSETSGGHAVGCPHHPKGPAPIRLEVTA